MVWAQAGQRAARRPHGMWAAPGLPRGARGGPAGLRWSVRPSLSTPEHGVEAGLRRAPAKSGGAESVFLARRRPTGPQLADGGSAADLSRYDCA